MVIGRGANIAIAGGNRCRGDSCADGPGGGAHIGGPPIVPDGRGDDIVSVTKRGDPTTGNIIRRGGSNGAVTTGNRCRGGSCAAGPGGCADIHRGTVPVGTGDDIVAVTQSDGSARANLIVGGRSHNAVAGANGADHSRISATPSYRANIGCGTVIPKTCYHDIVAGCACQGHHRGTYGISRSATNKAVGGTNFPK